MWNAPLYAVNMSDYHWLIKKLFLPMAGQNIASRKVKLNIGREKVKSREMPAVIREARCKVKQVRSLVVKYTIIQMVNLKELANNKPESSAKQL